MPNKELKKVRALPTPDYVVEDERELLEDDGEHNLLNPKDDTIYSASVIQRAVLTWLHLGKRNDFKYVCDYYNRLEKLEDTFPAHRKENSRKLEYELMKRSPPLSAYIERSMAELCGVVEPLPLPMPTSAAAWTFVDLQPKCAYDEKASAALAAALGVHLPAKQRIGL